ncbi:hypothetical protein [Trichocoleus sp. DQ-U1]|uniref:hypothetical protein n=1 Tax=Trichocoleus sp. DQ-U1 TaxID=2933926 RepID=UPI003297521A
MTPKKGKDESMFKSLLSQARGKDDQPEETFIEPAPIEPAPEAVEPRKAGRPRGRRSNPDYTQISAYIPLDLLLEVQTELLKERKSKRQRSAIDVSRLVEELLQKWVDERR